jgi:hypothetical protein
MHFLVAVITEDPNLLDDIMQPYDEQLDVEPYIDTTREMMEAEYLEFRERNIREAAIDPGDAEELKVMKKEAQRIIKETNNFGNLQWTYMDFAKWYHGTESFDEDGNALTTYNQNGRWDYYTIGGGWENTLMLNDGTTASKAKIKDIYFHGYDRIQSEKVKEYVEAEKKKQGDSWDRIMADNTPYSKEYFLYRYKTKENYVEESLMFAANTIITFDREWITIPNDTDERRTWTKNFYDDFIKNTNPEYYVVLVDCHT